MVACNCIVQEGQIPAETEASLRASITEFAQRNFGEPAEINWTAIPKNSGFTAGKPSTSSIVSLRSNTPLPQHEREHMLQELCGIWTRATQTTMNEIVGVISDPQTN